MLAKSSFSVRLPGGSCRLSFLSIHASLPRLGHVFLEIVQRLEHCTTFAFTGCLVYFASLLAFCGLHTGENKATHKQGRNVAFRNHLTRGYAIDYFGLSILVGGTKRTTPHGIECKSYTYFKSYPPPQPNL